jgi:hypothetical protein
MSKIALTPNASGTGVFTISSPATNTNRTLTLPDEAGTMALQGGAGVGKVLQVVNVVKTDNFTTTSTSYVDCTGLSVSITPTSSTSRLLVLANLFLGGSTDNGFTLGQLVRDTTVLGNNTSGSNAWANSGSLLSNTSRAVTHSSLSFLDAPATTSTLTYKIQVRVDSGGTGAVNKWTLNGDMVSTSSITVMEIAA